MARRGVWELRELLIKYSLDGGSSRGVREFVEENLVNFAKKNPQISIKTSLQSGNPTVHGKYITGYEKNLSLKNLTKEEVASRTQYLRDTLGCKTPKHNHMGFVERDFVSVQGFWRNSGDLRFPPLPEHVEKRKERKLELNFQKVVDEVGITGVAIITKKLLERQALAHQAAMEKLPKIEKVRATE